MFHRVGKGWERTVRVFARLALGLAFLSAVADRFAFFGPPGTTGTAWGDFHHFVIYTAQVNAFLPAACAPFLAVAATTLELALGFMLIFGLYRRIASVASAVLLSPLPSP